MAANKFKMAAIGLKYYNIFTKKHPKIKVWGYSFYWLDIFQVLIIQHIEINIMSQIQEEKQFKMAAKSPKWLQESLDWEISLISNLTLKI